MVMCKLHSLLFGGISEGNRAAAEVLLLDLALAGAMDTNSVLCLHEDWGMCQTFNVFTRGLCL